MAFCCFYSSKIYCCTLIFLTRFSLAQKKLTLMRGLIVLNHFKTASLSAASLQRARYGSICLFRSSQRRQHASLLQLWQQLIEKRLLSWSYFCKLKCILQKDLYSLVRAKPRYLLSLTPSRGKSDRKR